LKDVRDGVFFRLPDALRNIRKNRESIKVVSIAALFAAPASLVLAELVLAAFAGGASLVAVSLVFVACSPVLSCQVIGLLCS